MNVTVEPGLLGGALSRLPSSKSHVHRLLIAAALCRRPKEDREETRILCSGENEDIGATVNCLQRLNAAIIREGDGLKVISSLLWPRQAALSCGESGSTLRFLLPLCAAGPGEVTLTGRGRLTERPNGPYLEALRAHGAVIEGDSLPLTVRGGLRSGDYSLPGNVSSQYFTGLMFALPLLPGDSKLTYTSPLESVPYVELTLSVLRRFGIRVEKTENGWRIPGGQVYTSPGIAAAEADWSAAAFWLGANRLGSAVKLSGLDEHSFQGDKAVQKLLLQIGDEMDLRQTPDLMPVLSAVAAAVPGKTTRITGAARLRLKESDRLTAMAEVIRALGGSAEEAPDGLTVHGTRLRGGTVDGHGDHRVAMSAAIAATVCAGPVTILGAEAVNKSYPDFWRDFEQMGGRLHG